MMRTDAHQHEADQGYGIRDDERDRRSMVAALVHAHRSMFPDRSSGVVAP